MCRLEGADHLQRTVDWASAPQKRKSLQATRQEAESRLQRHKEAREQLEKEAELANSRAADVAAQIEVGGARQLKHHKGRKGCESWALRAWDLEQSVTYSLAPVLT